MIYVYAVLERGAAVPPLAGLEDAAVAGHEAGRVTLAASEHEAAPEPSREAVLRHAQVVEALAEAGAPVLPARFGLAFRDEAALQAAVAAQAVQLAAALERVRGCAEVGLRVLWPQSADGACVVSTQARPAAQPRGGDYLRARLRETTERERLATRLHDTLARHARDSTRAASSGRRLLLEAAYLVPRDGIEAFRREVGKLEGSHPELALLCTGPWPPYSFAPRGEAVP